MTTAAVKQIHPHIGTMQNRCNLMGYNKATAVTVASSIITVSCSENNTSWAQTSKARFPLRLATVHQLVKTTHTSHQLMKATMMSSQSQVKNHLQRNRSRLRTNTVVMLNNTIVQQAK